MCGRYTTRTTDGDNLAARFTFDDRGAGLLRKGLGRANVCPTEEVAAVVVGEDGSREPRLMRWGLAPSWGALRGGRPLINARDDKLRTSGAWKRLASSHAHSCLVLADGWLEWQKAEDPRRPRQPFLHELCDGAPFAFAGLWTFERPRDADAALASLTIVTTTPNREAAVLHDRMPAILAGPEAEAAWLHPLVGLDEALELAGPLADGVLRVSPVSTQLNTAGQDDVQLAMPL